MKKLVSSLLFVILAMGYANSYAELTPYSVTLINNSKYTTTLTVIATDHLKESTDTGFVMDIIPGQQALLTLKVGPNNVGHLHFSLSNGDSCAIRVSGYKRHDGYYELNFQECTGTLHHLNRLKWSSQFPIHIRRELFK